MTASFQLNFLIDTSGFRRNLNGLSDTLRFTDGWFKTKIRFSKR